MFTGIIEEVGNVSSIQRRRDAAKITIHAKQILEDVKPGDSIAVNGICLTAAEVSDSAFSADVMHETLNRTSFADIGQGSKVNLERALPANGRFGGHIVTGHIDGTGIIRDIRKDSIAVWYTIGTNEKILRYIIEKGSIAIDGIGLTVVKVSGGSFSVSMIPHTLEHTALASKKINQVVNLENDCIGKYIKKFLTTENASGITKEFLMKNEY